MNKLFDKIPNKPINTRGLKLGDLDYHKLMGDVNCKCTPEVAALYDQLNKDYRYKVNMKDEFTDNLGNIARTSRKAFADLGYTAEVITDMLVQYLYGSDMRYKQLLWFCYGGYVLNNLKRNVTVKKTKLIQCIDCGEWIEVDANNTKTMRCTDCQISHEKDLKLQRAKRYRERKKASGEAAE